jgi:hypothetical protein
MKQSKYVIVKTMGFEVPIVFNYFLDHSRVCQDMAVVSAGFCNRSPDGFTCWGNSTTLKIGSRAQDSMVLNRMLELES